MSKNDLQQESLEIFAAMYKNSVKEFIELCKNKVVAFDCDGTLTEFRYADKHLLPCKDAELNEYILQDNFYARAKFSVTMKYVIDMLSAENADGLYIVTTSMPNVAPLKTQRLMQVFPQIKEENIYHTSANTKKQKLFKRFTTNTKKKQCLSKITPKFF